MKPYPTYDCCRFGTSNNQFNETGKIKADATGCFPIASASNRMKCRKTTHSTDFYNATTLQKKPVTNS